MNKTQKKFYDIGYQKGVEDAKRAIRLLYDLKLKKDHYDLLGEVLHPDASTQQAAVSEKKE